jgi:deoxyribonuclease IV
VTRHIGAHVSIAGGPQNAPGRATEIGATAMGMFTKNQRQWKSKDLTVEETTQFAARLKDAGIPQEHVLVHASYLINPANPDPEKRERALNALLDEARRVEALGLTLVNFHPGSGLGEITEEESIQLIGQAMVAVLEQTSTAVLVIEATAGQGAHVGYTFEQLAAIISAAGGSPRIGVCIDTCHIFAGGYELRSAEDYRKTMGQFSDIVGMDRLVGIHLNDSSTEFASRHDRHASIGGGELGLPALARFITDPDLPDVPFVLETPQPERWAEEIALLSGIARGEIDPETATVRA